MTEDEWQASDDPLAMMELLYGLAEARRAGWLGRLGLRPYGLNARKLRLYAGHLRDLLREYTPGGLQIAEWAAAKVGRAKGRWAAHLVLAAAQQSNALLQVHGVCSREPQRRQAALIRCLFGNPFRPAAFDRAWRTPATVVRATAIEEARDFGLLPDLATALEAAGCSDAAVLGHCRGPGPHALGCWVLDAVMDRA